MKVKIDQAQCNHCHRKENCPEQDERIQVNDYVDWMLRNCPQYPKK